MTSDQNKSVIRRVFNELINAGNLTAADELLAADYVNHDLPAPAPGAAGFKQIIQMFRTAFPDIVITLDQVIAEGDRVATQGVFTGTHQGEFMGVPATGKRVAVKYIDIWRLEDGKGRENWVRLDIAGLMQQLGVMPAQA
jgi:steroid delta-isomerase-like uncharacterized protein